MFSLLRCDVTPSNGENHINSKISKRVCRVHLSNTLVVVVCLFCCFASLCNRLFLFFVNISKQKCRISKACQARSVILIHISDFIRYITKSWTFQKIHKIYKQKCSVSWKCNMFQMAVGSSYILSKNSNQLFLVEHSIAKFTRSFSNSHNIITCT